MLLPRIQENYAENQLNQLWGRLESENATVRLYAIRECGSRHLLKAEDKLTSMVLTDPDLDLRLATYHILEGMGMSKMRVILNALNNPPNNGYKINIIRLLGRISNNRQVDSLTEAYLKDTDTFVRLAILSSK